MANNLTNVPFRFILLGQLVEFIIILSAIHLAVGTTPWVQLLTAVVAVIALAVLPVFIVDLVNDDPEQP